MANTPAIEVDEFQDRHRRIRDRMRAEGFDALIAYSNVRVRGCVQYLSNYFVRWAGAQSQPDGSYQMYGSSAVFFPLDEEPILVTDHVWDEERARGVSVIQDTHYSQNLGVEFGRLCSQRGCRKVGIDNWFIFPAMHYLPLRELAAQTVFEPTQLIENIYKIKSPAEIALIRRAEKVAIRGIEAGVEAVDVGVREYDFAVAAENAMRLHGELELAANCVICGGPHTASGTDFPRRADSYVMKRGDWAMFDLTPSYGGYGGDICRMIVAGSLKDLDSDLREMYDVTLRMSDEVIAAIRPGVIPRELNELAQSVADKAGYGRYKFGLVGHGVGLDIADPPDYYYDASPVEENMCFTVEPCLTIPGVAGCRIEDLVLVTPDGCEVLSAECSKELRGTEIKAR